MVQGDRLQVAINLENDRLTAVCGEVRDRGKGPGRLEIRSWVSVDRPAGVEPADTTALGRWVGDVLRERGLFRAARSGGAVFAVPRGEVVLKRIVFPPGTSASDLPGMVRLQLVRQLTVSPEHAAVDFVPITPGIPDGKRRGAGSAPAGSVSVLAGALQGDRVAWRRQVAKSAGIRLRRLGLRAAGAAALLAEAAQRRGGSTLGITLGSGSTEFAVVEDGQLVFARATDLFRPDAAEDVEAFAQKVAVEAKRTWMSYRVAPETTEIEAVVVLGADETARQVAGACAGVLELPSEAQDYPAFVEVPAEMGPADRTAMAPLVGLLAERVLDRAAMDFANPRRAPDLAAARRQRVLLAALVAIVGGGSLWTAARMDLQRQQQTVRELEARLSDLGPRYSEAVRTRAWADHVDAWMSARVDWMAHLAEITAMLPDARAGVLERLEASGQSAVSFDPPRARSYQDGSWQTLTSAAFEVVGTVRNRDIADAFRKTLVEDSQYQVESRGPDTSDRFDLILRTQHAKPGSRAGRPEAGGSA